MIEKEDKMIEVRCAHEECKEVTKVLYAEVFEMLRANHFYRHNCTKCGKRTFMTYKIDAFPCESGVLSQEILMERGIK